MVLEHLFPENWLEKKVGYAFLLAIGYSIIGILVARVLFGRNPGIVSVIFISILLLPSLRKMFAIEEKIEEKEKRFSLKELLFDNRGIIKTYFAIFFGIFFTYLFFSFVLPQFGIDIFNVFKEQLFLDPGLRGHAYLSGTFWSILENNWWVLVACFILGLFTGDGAIFFIAWNASAWGTIFGYRALSAGIYAGVNPWYYLLILLGIVIWHIILEGGAYIIVATAGSVISKDIISKSKEVRKFVIYSLFAGMLLIVFYFLLKQLILSSGIYFMISVGIFLIALYFMSTIFDDKKHREVFTYNYWLFVIGIIIFILGALLEAGVLSYSGMLNKIYSMSYMFI